MTEQSDWFSPENEENRKLKRQKLLPNTKWIRPKFPNYVVIVKEVYPSRVIGTVPSGKKFRCSLGVFLQEFEPLDQLTQDPDNS